VRKKRRKGGEKLEKASRWMKRLRMIGQKGRRTMDDSTRRKIHRLDTLEHHIRRKER
jgi:hypothetical protein